MRIWIDVLNSSFVTVGDGPLVRVVSARAGRKLNMAGDWNATVAADSRAMEVLQEKRIALIWGAEIGQSAELLGGGVIEEITARIGADGAPQLEIGGGDLLSVLASVDAGTGEYLDMKAQILARISSLPAAWSVVEIDSFWTWGARLAHESVLAALAAATEKRDFHFRWAPSGSSDVRRMEWFVVPRDSGITAFGDGDIESNLFGCRVTTIEDMRAAHDLKNKLFVYGAGNADVRLTLAAANAWPDGSAISSSYMDGSGNTWTVDLANSAILCSSSLSLYGQHEGVLEFGDVGPLSNNTADMISAANMLLLVALQAGRYMVTPQRTYRMGVAGLRTGLMPGELIYVDVQRWIDGERPIDIRQFMVILEVGTQVAQDGVANYDLVVSTQAAWPVSDIGAMVKSVQAGVVTRAYPQLNANSYVLPFSKSIDFTAAAAFRFRLGAEVTQLQQVLFEFQVLPLESTVRSVVAESTTSSAGGDSTQTSTYSAPNTYHAHNIPIPSIGGGPYGSPVYIDGTFGLNAATSGTGGADPVSVDITHAHSLSIPAHTHTVTPTIQTDYGIFRESGSNTLGLVEIEYQVNGEGWAYAGTATAVGSGWYQLDITALLQDAVTLRPLQESNLVEMRGMVDKTCAIDAQLSVRNVIQAIAYR